MSLGDLDAAALALEYPRGTVVSEYFSELMQPLDLEGRTVLDIGGGSGLWSILCSEYGASVTCIDPISSGSNARMLEARLEYLRRAEHPDRVHFVDEEFQTFEADGQFDIVLLHNSVNHLDEDACRRLSLPEAQEKYLTLFRRMRRFTATGGALVLTDCARRNLFGDIHLRNPFVPSIDWSVHQQPRIWMRLIEASGFTTSEIRWRFSSRAPYAIRRALSNRLGSYLSSSHFVLHASTAR